MICLVELGYRLVFGNISPYFKGNFKKNLIRMTGGKNLNLKLDFPVVLIIIKSFHINIIIQISITLNCNLAHKMAYI